MLKRHFYRRLAGLGLVLLLGGLFACAPPPRVEPPVEEVPVEEAPPPVAVRVPPLTPVDWSEISGWEQDALSPALEVFMKSCQSLKWRDGWKEVCREAASLNPHDRSAARLFFETRFQAYQVRNADGSETGMITGYYAPDLRGSRQQTARFRYPLYAVPDDLLVVDLGSVYPELGNYRLRGRVEGRRVVPYWTREEIDGGKQPLAGQEIFWVEDPVELFFLHIQGSGRILPEGEEPVMVNYGDQNGHPYRSIGKLLLERGAMTRDQMSMQNIAAWARKNPDQVNSLLGENPSYIFFRELTGVQSPPGAMGIPLTAGLSLAVDPRTIPLGSPVFLQTTWPSSDLPLQRLMVAQDTGGAIKGAVRADFFWGVGDDAGAYAGRMKQQGRLWVLLPKDMTPPGL